MEGLRKWRCDVSSIGLLPPDSGDEQFVILELYPPAVHNFTNS